MRCCLRLSPLVGVVLLALPPISQAADTPKANPIDFNRQIRPILADNCFTCHGRDEKQRQKKLRLDIAKGAYAELDSGVGHAVVPGKPDESELIDRVTSKD